MWNDTDKGLAMNYRFQFGHSAAERGFATEEHHKRSLTGQMADKVISKGLRRRGNTIEVFFTEFRMRFGRIKMFMGKVFRDRRRDL